MDAQKPPEIPASKPGLRDLGRALRHRNYRLFFAGQSVSLIGTWLTRMATSWLVYRLTHSSWLLGVVGFAGQIPAFLVAPLAGVWVDRWNRHRTLVVTQALAMLQSAMLAVLALTGTINVTWIIVLNVAQGLINAFDMPARQAFVVEMVTDRNDLPNAIALNSSMVHAARLLGPSVGGVLIALVGEGLCFAIDAASYAAVIASLMAMHLTARAAQPKGGRVLTQLREGLAYVVRSVPIRAVLLLLALVSLMGMPYSVLMPVIATQVFHGGANTLGALMAASGLGALCGALYLASRRSVLGLGRIIAGTAATAGLGLMAFSRSHTLWLSLVLILIAGGAMMVQMAASNTILQTIVDEDKRGRVMSFFSMAFFGSLPFGSLFAGSLAERIGAQNTILCGGVCCVAGAALFLRELPELRRAMRPIYVRLGILPEGADGTSAAPSVEVPPD